jgi:hypothetical protein
LLRATPVGPTELQGRKRRMRSHAFQPTPSDTHRPSGPPCTAAHRTHRTLHGLSMTPPPRRLCPEVTSTCATIHSTSQAPQHRHCSRCAATTVRDEARRAATCTFCADNQPQMEVTPTHLLQAGHARRCGLDQEQGIQAPWGEGGCNDSHL